MLPSGRRLAASARLAGVIGLSLVLVACASTGSGAGARDDASSRYLSDFVQAEARGLTFIPLTEMNPRADLAEAYRLQRRIVAQRVAAGDAVAGYKGGLMSAKSLADRGVREPLTGVLFASGMERSGAEVQLCNYRRAAFEMKLGYVFTRSIDGPVPDVRALRALVGWVQPVVELPDIAYRDELTYGAIDMAGGNISSARYVVGERQAVDQTNLDDLTVSMTRGGAPVTQGRGRESLGDQWESLRTVVNLVIANGGRIGEGTLVITGKIGDKGILSPAQYVADYGPLGRVAFSAKSCRAKLTRSGS